MKENRLSERFLRIKKYRDGKNQKWNVLKLAFSKKKMELAQLIASKSKNRKVGTSS
jgi:hypothetical protein